MGQRSSVTPPSDAREGKVSSRAVKLFGSPEAMQGTLIAGGKA